MARKALQKIQLGRETTAGVPVAATTIWRGNGSMLDDQREVTQVEELVGILGGTDRSYIAKLLGGIELAETEATFEQLPYLFAMAFGGPVTATPDAGTGATGQIYETIIPTTSVPTKRTYTIETGDDFEVEQMPFAHCTELSVSGKVGEALKMSATLVGSKVERKPDGFTPSLALPVVEDILVSKGRLYIDAIDGSYGTTQVSNSILGFSLTYSALWVPRFTMDGELTFSGIEYTGHTIEGEITFEHNAAASSEKSYWRTNTPRLLSVKLFGSALSTAGAAYSHKTAQFNLPIRWTKFEPIDEEDGVSIVVGKFTSRYNATAGNAGSVIVVNENAALA